MRVRCDACEGAAATVVCCADEAALCASCDVEIHAANKLASKHQRLPLETLSSRLPRCDVCLEKPAFIFCVEDRALFCRDCDESIHVPGTLSGEHQRYLATGIRVGFGSTCNNSNSNSNNNHTPPRGNPAPRSQTAQTTGTTCVAVRKAPPAAQEVPSSPFLPSGWAVDDLLEFSDYESNSKLQKESPLGFKELEWLAEMDLFHEQVPGKWSRTAAEVPELFSSQAPSNAASYKTSKAAVAGGGVRQHKKPRIAVSDEDEDYFLVPDLG